MKYLREFNTKAEYNASIEDIPYPNVVLVNEEQKVYYASPITSTIRINQNLTDSTQIVSGDINGEAIRMIRQHSHRYLGKYTADGTMSICQLDDNDSTKYADGTDADLSGAEGDVFMKMPSFGYKAVEVEPNIWEISFCFGDISDASWKSWNGNELIGVYRAHKKNDALYSISAGVVCDIDSVEKSRLQVSRRGQGFSLIKWKHRSIMAFLMYALYGNTDSWTVCGKGAKSQVASGLTNSLGMNDTTPENGDGVMVNFWGLEQWWGGYGEYIDNVMISDDEELGKCWTITEDDGSVRTVKSAKLVNYSKITKLLIGNYLDAIPVESKVYYTMPYAFGGYESGSQFGLLQMGGDTPYYYSDMMTISSKKELTLDGSYDTSRIVFNGKIIKERDVETFKSLSAIS